MNCPLRFLQNWYYFLTQAFFVAIILYLYNTFILACMRTALFIKALFINFCLFKFSSICIVFKALLHRATLKTSKCIYLLL